MTKTFPVTLVLAAALTALAACQPAGQTGTSGQAPATPVRSAADIKFINTAGVLRLEEVTFARLAETKATDQAVRQAAKTMVADLAAVDQQLAALAPSDGTAPAPAMDGRHEGLYQQLQSLTGSAFDRQYINDDLQDLTMAIQAYQAEADTGSDPQLRAFAQQQLPTMLQELQTAGSIGGL
jgi:putative membrane protein